MKRLMVVLGCALALVPAAASGSDSRLPSPRAATAAFGRLLYQLYGTRNGYWTCPHGQVGVGGGIGCLGEVSHASGWHRVSAVADFSHGVTWVDRVSAVTWKRNWSAYSRHYILRSGEGQVPGVVSVNSPAYDWGWLALCAEGLHAGHTNRCDAYDGDSAGLSRFYLFTCARRGSVTMCRNALGDAMRYRPRR